MSASSVAFCTRWVRKYQSRSSEIARLITLSATSNQSTQPAPPKSQAQKSSRKIHRLCRLLLVSLLSECQRPMDVAVPPRIVAGDREEIDRAPGAGSRSSSSSTVVGSAASVRSLAELPRGREPRRRQHLGHGSSAQRRRVGLDAAVGDRDLQGQPIARVHVGGAASSSGVAIPAASTSRRPGEDRVVIDVARPTPSAAGRWRSASGRRRSRARRASGRRRRWRRAGRAPRRDVVRHGRGDGRPVADRLQVVGLRGVDAVGVDGLARARRAPAPSPRHRRCFAPVPTISVVTVVLPPGGTDGGSALIASTRGPLM